MANAETTDPKDESGKEHSSSDGHLTLYIVIAVIAAIALALWQPDFARKFEIGGEIFLRLLQMVVVPLVMASVMSGILGLGDVR
ncbi:MAG: dicarboxylate/amino acid:cation symporter, partial [Planctomycetales bacterium]